MTSAWYVIVVAVFLAFRVQISRASGTIELQIVSFQNYRGELGDGTCCGGLRTKEGTCPLQCNTEFRLCFKEYQSQVESDGACTFGKESTGVVFGNSFSLQSEPNKRVVLKLPFTFRWTVSRYLDFCFESVLLRPPSLSYHEFLSLISNVKSVKCTRPE